MRQLSADQLILTDQCPDCKGVGSVKQSGMWLWCEDCDGTGRIIKRDRSGMARALAIAAYLGLIGLIVRWIVR